MLPLPPPSHDDADVGKQIATESQLTMPAWSVPAVESVPTTEEQTAAAVVATESGGIRRQLHGCPHSSSSSNASQSVSFSGLSNQEVYKRLTTARSPNRNVFGSTMCDRVTH